VAAGIVNPITGQRLVKSWRGETLLPAARATYREIEAQLGVRLWHEMRIRRLFANERERAIFAEKQARGDLAPFVDAAGADAEGFWIREGARVDFRALLSGSRMRWMRQGRFTEAASADKFDRVIDCTGAAILRSDTFKFVSWECSKGEILEIAIEGLAPDVILNRRQWVVPINERSAWVGATHEPGVRDSEPTPAARTSLESSARELLGGRPFRLVQQRAGLRVTLPDKRPVAGVHPQNPRLGVLNGLAAKGALWAPLLARQWARHLAEGAVFDPEIDVRRFTDRAERLRSE
jgi:glycine/D-amino acid oxidase-like deaminating enzyme